MSKGYISPFLKEAVIILSPPESAEWSEGGSSGRVCSLRTASDREALRLQPAPASPCRVTCRAIWGKDTDNVCSDLAWSIGTL